MVDPQRKSVRDVLRNPAGLNDTLLSATRLLSDTPAVGPATEFHARGGFGSARDVDYYRITVPPSEMSITW